MIPRFSNPHTVLVETQVVSRKQLYETEEEDGCSLPDPGMVDKYNALMKRTLPQFGLHEGENEQKKRPRVETRESQEEGIERVPILFRLISNGPPVLVSLEPRPPAQVKVKEPQTEDTEAQAMERHKRALAVAVTMNCVMQESRNVDRRPPTQSPVLHVSLPSPLATPPPVLILHHDKPVRKTRPPVRDKLEYPYDASSKPAPLETPPQGYPVIDLNRSINDTAGGKKKRRHRRNIKEIEHKFWRPDPTIKGKCQGYAMGHTSGRRYQLFGPPDQFKQKRTST